MGNFTGIMNLIQLCTWLGTMIVCIVLVISSVLRWLAHPEERRTRLNYASWIAFAILSVTLLRPGISSIMSSLGTEEGNEKMTYAVINISKATVKLAILGTVVLAVVVILLVLIVFITKGVAAIVHSGSKDMSDWAKVLEKISNDFGAVTKTPVFTFLLTCGILIAFVILPFLMGGSSNGEGLAKTWENGVGLAKTWENGVIELSRKMLQSSNSSSYLSLSTALLTYILLFIIVLGVGFTIVRILHAIIKDNLKERNTAGIIDEYAGSMGILGVGVSILFALQSSKPSDTQNSTTSGVSSAFEGEILNKIIDFFKYFVIVAVVMALVIVVLEIIRLTVDMRETLIRREAKYLFIALTGQVSLLVFSMIHTIYSALNSAIGGKLNINMERIQSKLVQHMVDTMEEEADSEAGHHETTFIGFNGKVTKK